MFLALAIGCSGGSVHTVDLEAPEGSAVSLDGKLLGEGSRFRLTLTGNHKITIVPGAAKVEPPSSPIERVELTADQLFKQHDANAVRFEGRPLRVTGPVETISRGTHGGLYVYIKGPTHPVTRRMRGAQAVMQKESDVETLRAINPGDVITLDCIGGKASLGEPGLDDCALAH